jgi:hypothetical protein
MSTVDLQMGKKKKKTAKIEVDELEDLKKATEKLEKKLNQKKVQK